MAAVKAEQLASAAERRVDDDPSSTGDFEPVTDAEVDEARTRLERPR